MEGARELSRDLDLAPKVALQATRAATHKVAVEHKKEAVKLAPKDTGTLQKSMKAKRSRVRKGEAASNLVIIRGTSRRSKDGAWYFHFVEKGTRSGNIKKPGVGYIRTSWRRVDSKAPEIYNQGVNKYLAGWFRRQAKKRGHNS